MKKYKYRFERFLCSPTMLARYYYTYDPYEPQYLSPTTPYRKLFNYRLARRFYRGSKKKVRYYL